MNKALILLKEELSVINCDKMMQRRAKRLNEAIAELEEAMKPKTCEREVFYKCVHCCDTFKTIKEVEEHENDCSYNPIACKCDTCKSLIWEYGNDYCPFWKEKGTYDTWDNREKCPYHEPKENE